MKSIDNKEKVKEKTIEKTKDKDANKKETVNKIKGNGKDSNRKETKNKDTNKKEIGNETVNAENKQKNQDIDDGDINQRRNSRLTYICSLLFGSVAIAAYCSTILLNHNIKIIQGSAYLYNLIFLLLSCSAAILVFIKVIVFVLQNSRRLDVTDKNYREYDLSSDKMYSGLVHDSIIYIVTLLFIFIVLIIVPYQYFNITLILIVLAIIIYLSIIWGRDRKMFIGIFKTIFYWIAFTFLVYITSGVLDSGTSSISVRFANNGIIEISNSSNLNFENPSIEIEISSDDGKINDSKITEEIMNNSLKASESEHIVKKEEGEVNEIEYSKSNIQHYKTEIDLKKLDGIKKGEHFNIKIESTHSKYKIILENEFIVNDNEYIYAIETLKKDYK